MFSLCSSDWIFLSWISLLLLSLSFVVLSTIFPEHCSFTSVDICMKSIYRQNAFVTSALSLSSLVRFHRDTVEGLGGGSGEATEKWFPKGCSDPVALTPTDQSEPAPPSPKQTSRKCVLHGGLWAAEKGVTITMWKIHLLEKDVNCLRVPFSLSKLLFKMASGQQMKGGWRWESMEQWPCIFPLCFFVVFVFLPFLGLYPWHMEIARLGVESELSDGLRQSHSNMGSKPHPQPTPQLTATRDP